MLLDKTITQLAQGLRNHDFTCVDIVTECYQNIEKYNQVINAFISIIPKEIALEKAADADKNLANSKSKLFGLPFVLKDCFVTKDLKTTCSSKVLENFVSPYNATVYEKLIKAGAILIGKTNMDAWGHGGSSENNDYGPVKNPWDVTRVAGGSSGGPAAAIAAKMAVFAIGEDTGGSIRNPSGWCNITGLKVTYGRVSRYGSISYASSFDTVGPMAKTVEDCALILEAIAGVDKYDATSSNHPVSLYSHSLTENSHLTIGLPQEFFGDGLNQEIKNQVLNVANTLKEKGHTVKDISLPIIDYCIPVYYLIGPSETSSNLARYDGVRYGNNRENFTPETIRRILIGTYALSAGFYDAYYKKAQQVRTFFINEYNKAFNQCDVILQPIMPTPPTKIGEIISDPLQNLLADIYTVSQNPVGVPSLAIPCGFTKDNLPIGVQLVGKMFTEEILLRLGHQFQQITNFHLQSPKL